jgi:hypothetical protein
MHNIIFFCLKLLLNSLERYGLYTKRSYLEKRDSSYTYNNTLNYCLINLCIVVLLVSIILIK